MRGTLVGMLFLQTAANGLISIITTSTPAGTYWEYYAAFSVLVFISLIIYSIVAYRYKYRQRNEISDINMRVTIEEIYERNLGRGEEREDDQNVVFTRLMICTTNFSKLFFPCYMCCLLIRRKKI